MKYLPLLLLSVSLIACKEADQQTTAAPFDKEAVREQMKKLVSSYGNAIEQMDTAKTISHFADNNEFYVYADGVHYTFKDMKKAVKEGFFTGLKKVQIEWDTVNVRVLSQTEAACLIRLTEILTDTNDVQTKVAVEATFVGSSKNNEWKIVYGHASHRVITDKK